MEIEMEHHDPLRGLEHAIRRERALHDAQAVAQLARDDRTGLIEVPGAPRDPHGLPSGFVHVGGELLGFAVRFHIRTLVLPADAEAPEIRRASPLFAFLTLGYPNERVPPMAAVYSADRLFLPAVDPDVRAPMDATALFSHVLGGPEMNRAVSHQGMACLVAKKDWDPDRIDLVSLVEQARRICCCAPSSLNYRGDAMSQQALDYVLEHPEISDALADQVLDVDHGPAPVVRQAADEWDLEGWS